MNERTRARRLSGAPLRTVDWIKVKVFAEDYASLEEINAAIEREEISDIRRAAGKRWIHAEAAAQWLRTNGEARLSRLFNDLYGT